MGLEPSGIMQSFYNKRSREGWEGIGLLNFDAEGGYIYLEILDAKERASPYPTFPCEKTTI